MSVCDRELCVSVRTRAYCLCSSVEACEGMLQFEYITEQDRSCVGQ